MKRNSLSKLLKGMIKQIIIGISTAVGISVLSVIAAYNAWSWQVDAVAAEVGGLKYEAIVDRSRDISKEIYELERLQETAPDEFTERDALRLEALEKDLEVNDKRLDAWIQQDPN